VGTGKEEGDVLVPSVGGGGDARVKFWRTEEKAQCILSWLISNIFNDAITEVP
jgi:hypothetical protein